MAQSAWLILADTVPEYGRYDEGEDLDFLVDRLADFELEYGEWDDAARGVIRSVLLGLEHGVLTVVSGHQVLRCWITKSTEPI